MDEFSRCLPRILVSEGGYTNNPKDPGGPTNKGIIQRVYNDYRTTEGQPVQSVQLITDAEVSAIYRERYWDIAKLDKLAPGVSYVVFDGNVNSGVSQSIKWLQRALAGMGLYQGAIDGIIGTGTLTAAAGADPVALINAICDRRLAFLKALKTYKYFGKGWSSRVASVRATAIAWANDTTAMPVASFVDGGNAKALISDAKSSPVLALADSSSGGGVVTGAAAGYIASAKDQLSQFAGSVHFVDNALLGLTVASLALVGGGAAYRWYAARKRTERADVLDLPTAPTSAQVTPTGAV